MGMYAGWEEDGSHGATSWNYQQFMTNNPKLTAFYFHVSQILWAIGFVAGLLSGTLALSKRNKKAVAVSVLLVGYILLYGLLFALRGTGMYDYKLALLPVALSQVPGCYTCIHYFKKK